VSEDIKSNQALYTGNSMPVRDLDTFLFPSEKTFNTFGNRGASGIDGITSSAIGVAAVTGEQATLIIGDLSFYHDLNGLLEAKHYHLPIRIILLNNNGGGIFSSLKQTKEAKEVKVLIGVLLDINKEKVATRNGGTYTTITNKQNLKRE